LAVVDAIRIGMALTWRRRLAGGFALRTKTTTAGETPALPKKRIRKRVAHR
jgi:hypothetical protein